MVRHRAAGRRDGAAKAPTREPAPLAADTIRRDTPATAAVLLACLSALAATAAWTLLLLPAGNVRFDPLFWLLALPFCVWAYPVLRSRPGALRRLPWSLVAWPIAGCAAAVSVVLVPGIAAAGGLVAGPAVPLAAAALSAVAAAGGLVAWRRSVPAGAKPSGHPAPRAPRDADRPAAPGQSPVWLGMGAPLVVALLFWLADQAARIPVLTPLPTALGAIGLAAYFILAFTAIRREARMPGRAPSRLAPILAPAICLALTGVDAAMLLRGPDPVRAWFGWIMLAVTVFCAVSAWRSDRRGRRSLG